jgi:hypothetical protein
MYTLTSVLCRVTELLKGVWAVLVVKGGKWFWMLFALSGAGIFIYSQNSVYFYGKVLNRFKEEEVLK